jgi:hypothetical protein
VPAGHGKHVAVTVAAVAANDPSDATNTRHSLRRAMRSSRSAARGANSFRWHRNGSCRRSNAPTVLDAETIAIGAGNLCLLEWVRLNLTSAKATSVPLPLTGRSLTRGGSKSPNAEAKWRACPMPVDEELTAVDASLVELRQIPHDCGNCRCYSSVITCVPLARL